MGSRRVALLVQFALLALPLFASAATDALLLEDGARAAGASVTVLERGAAGCRLQFELAGFERTSVSLSGRTYVELAIPAGGFRGAENQAALPTYTRLVAVPDGLGVTAAIVERDLRPLGALALAPLRPIADARQAAPALDLGAYRATPTSRPEVIVGEPALLHGLRVVPVTFAPVGYDAASGEVTAAASLTVDLAFTGGDTRAPAGPAASFVPESFATLYEEVVLGWERGDQVEVGPGSIVYICPDIVSVTSIIEPLARWRREQGYRVDVVTTATTGPTNTSIRAWLMNHYATCDPPLEFVTLVGDANGSIAVPCFVEQVSGYGGEGDHDYSRLDGNDVLPDVHVGRLSVRSTTELQLAVDKILDYERQPDLSDPDWFTTAGLTGDPSTSGYTCIYTNQFAKQELLRLGYTQIDTIWGGNFVSQMMATISQGETFFTYRGLGGMSGMTYSHIQSTSNGRKLPFACILTCDTGSFMDDTTARSEAFLRAPQGGGIGAIGTATSGTHTRYNNCMFLGIVDHLLDSGDFRLGPALTRGKVNFYINYWTNEQNKVWSWLNWNNLMGDPATEMWTSVPQTLEVIHPDALAPTAVALPVDVTSGGSPVAGARVAAFQAGAVRSVGYTDDAGHATLDVSGAALGDVSLTVTGHAYQPYRSVAAVGPVARSLDLADVTVADGGGNGDGQANPGESLRVGLRLINGGTSAAPDVTARLVDGPSWATFDPSPVSFGTIGAGATAAGTAPVNVSLLPGAPGGVAAVFELVATSGAESWTSLLTIPVVGARGSVYLASWGVPGGSLDPGESGTVTLLLQNLGDRATAGATGTLRCGSRWVDVTDPDGAWGAAAAGGFTNQTDLFGVTADPACYPGHLAAFTLELTFAEGGTQVIEFQTTVGTAGAGDPTGPDTYGYYAFSNDDTDPWAPEYQWVDASLVGENVGIADDGLWDDETRVVDLPFPFTYYGETFDKVSICSNGWLAFGATGLKFYRNWMLPADGSPDAMVAAFWDDLAGGEVYAWHDAANHRFVVQWNHFKTRYANETYNGDCTFEIILTEPAFSGTDTGDGLITLQYAATTIVGDETTYFTVGLQNRTRDVGLTYAYGNHYAGGAASLGGGRAIAFVPVATVAQGTVAGTVRNLNGGGTPIPGAMVSVVGANRAFTTGDDGTYAGLAAAGTWDLAFSHPSCAPDTVRGVVVVQDQVSLVDVDLLDVGGPAFTGTTHLVGTDDTVGPYVVESTIDDLSGVAERHAYYTSSVAGGPFELPLTLVDADAGRWRAEIPGQPLGARVQYWLTAVDELGLAAADPPGAPWPCYSFQVQAVAVLVDEDFESGVGDWHVNLDGQDGVQLGAWEYGDPVGTYGSGGDPVQPEDDHTPAPGVNCWFTGQHVAGQSVGYGDVDGGPTTLWSPVWNVAGSGLVTVSYWRWFSNDAGSNPGEDPWQVQVSNDAGDHWTDVEYTFASDAAWQQVSFDLATFFAVPDQLRLRFLATDVGNGSLVEAALDDVHVSAVAVTPDLASPTVQLASPDGGETYAEGQVMPIVWTAADDVGVVEARISISLDGGATWGDPVLAGPFDGGAAWTVALPDGGSQQARVRVEVLDGAGRVAADVSDGVFTLTTETTVAPPPTALALAQNHPNPFNPQTVIVFDLPRAQDVRLSVYDLQGRRVRTLVQDALPAGRHEVTWRGHGDDGREVASGTYVYRLAVDEGVLVRKMVLLK
ncbi:MAG: C25 family cysteine peptidase [Candidatus Krumholzibacteriia bacterium]